MSDPDQRNKRFTDWLWERRIISSKRILDAFLCVPRYKFLPNVDLDKVYQNSSVVTKKIGRKSVSSATKPGVVAVMLHQLQLEMNQKVLEVGAGTGYNASLMAQIVGPNGSVVSLDIDPEVIQIAKENRSSFNFNNLSLVCADGWLGYNVNAPYDRIIFTVGVNDIPTFWQEQLKENGILLIPLWLKNGIQRTIAFRKINGILVSESIRKCDFMRLRGPMAGSETYTFLDDSSSLITGVENEQDKEYLSRLFSLLSSNCLESKLDEAYVLSGNELEDLIFYIGLKGSNCLTIADYEGKDLFFAAQALGIYDVDKESLFVIKYDRQRCLLSRQYNLEEAGNTYYSLFKEWLSENKPGDLSMRVTIFPKEKAIPAFYQTASNTFIFEKTSSYVIYEINVALEPR